MIMDSGFQKLMHRSHLRFALDVRRYINLQLIDWLTEMHGVQSVSDAVCSLVTRRSGWTITATAQLTRSTRELSPKTSSDLASPTSLSQS